MSLTGQDHREDRPGRRHRPGLRWPAAGRGLRQDRLPHHRHRPGREQGRRDQRRAQLHPRYPLCRRGRAGSAGRSVPPRDYAVLADLDVVFICVPTPYTAAKAPDISFIVSAAGGIAEHLHRGQLIILQSTTYPGTTEEVVLPILEAVGLKAGTDFHLAFSPERVDPGNRTFTVANTPKVVGGLTPACAAHRRPPAGADHAGRPHRLHAPGGRADQAAGEHLPQRQHRPGQRAGPALRAHGHRHLGGDRGRLQQALRLHALHAGAGRWRPLHSRGPLLPLVEGPGVRFLHQVHRAGSGGEPEHALPRGAASGQTPWETGAGPCRAPKCWSWAWPSSATSTMPATPRQTG